MNKRERENWFRTVNRLAELGIGFRTAEALRRLSLRYCRSLEAECSIDDDRQNPVKGFDSAHSRTQDRLEKQARAMMPEGIELYIQGDCRGLSFYVCGPDVRRPLDQHYSEGVGL